LSTDKILAWRGKEEEEVVVVVVVVVCRREEEEGLERFIYSVELWSESCREKGVRVTERKE
jgi:hypothetical protein